MISKAQRRLQQEVTVEELKVHGMAAFNIKDRRMSSHRDGQYFYLGIV